MWHLTRLYLRKMLVVDLDLGGKSQTQQLPILSLFVHM